jgi:hypothetical protein
LAVGESPHRLRIGGEVFETRLDRNGVIVIAFLLARASPHGWLACLARSAMRE